MGNVKISDLPPIDEYNSVQEYLEARKQGKARLSSWCVEADLWQMALILQKQNDELKDRVKYLEELVIPLG